jgi:transcriptional regulator with XRE-family HTH domain
MSRSPKPGKVRKPIPNTVGAGFGTLVRRYREQRCMTQEQLAVRIYGDEARKSSVSDIERGVSRTHRAHTVGLYMDALNIPANEVENIRTQLNTITPDTDQLIAEIHSGINKLLGRQNDSGGTDGVVEETLTVVGSHEATREVDLRLLRDIVSHFLANIGHTEAPPYLWPSTLKDLAFEILQMRMEISSQTKLPPEIAGYTDQASSALARGGRPNSRVISRHFAPAPALARPVGNQSFPDTGDSGTKMALLSG